MLPGGEVSKKRETLCKALWKLAMAKCLKQSKLVNSKVWTSAPCQVRKRIDAPFNTDETDLAKTLPLHTLQLHCLDPRTQITLGERLMPTTSHTMWAGGLELETGSAMSSCYYSPAPITPGACASLIMQLNSPIGLRPPSWGCYMCVWGNKWNRI